MKFKFTKRANPNQPTAPKKYYPSAVNAGKMTTAALVLMTLSAAVVNVNAQDAKHPRHLTVMNPNSSEVASFNVETLDGLKLAGNNVDIKMIWDGKQKSYNYPTLSIFTFDPLEKNCGLRAEEMQLDSIVTYTGEGKPAYAYKMSGGFLRWENNRWEVDPDWTNDAFISFYYYVGKPEVKFQDGWYQFSIPRIDGWQYWQLSRDPLKTTTDKNGNLTKVEVDEYQYFLIKYNAYNQPVSVDRYISGTQYQKFIYEYDDHIHDATGRTLFEAERWDDSKKQWIPINKQVRKFANEAIVLDETYDGVNGKWAPSSKREVLYNSNGQRSRMNHYEGVNDKWALTYYTIYYYSDPESNETVSPTSISLNDGLLQVNTPQAERISVYSISGALLLSADKPAGECAYGLPCHKGVFIVRGSSGWVRKVLAR